jgi:Spy/CpxP family protein refolding chaperone
VAYTLLYSRPNYIRNKYNNEEGEMKRNTLIITGIALLTSILVASAFAHSPGRSWGWGHHMMHSWGRGGLSGDLSEDQRNEISRLDQKYYNETVDLRKKLWTLETELQTVLSSESPDVGKAKSIQKDISDLRAKLDEKRIEYETEARKVVPDATSGYYGHHMSGYGPGACWY